MLTKTGTHLRKSLTPLTKMKTKIDSLWLKE